LLGGFAFDLAFDVEPVWPRWAKLVGGLLIMIGVGIVAAGLGTLWRSGTTVDPAKGATVLVVSSPYRVSRNPAYVGWCFIYVGVAVWGGSLAALILLPLAMAGVQHFAIRRKEAHLLQRFGRPTVDTNRACDDGCDPPLLPWSSPRPALAAPHSCS